MAVALGGCHTLEGAGTGAMYSMYLLAEAGGSSSCSGHGGEAEAVAIVAVLAVGTVTGAACGAVEDIKELCVYIERHWDDWPWEPSERDLARSDR